jgi:hypothetical protein
LIADRKTQYAAMRFTAPSVNGAVVGQGGGGMGTAAPNNLSRFSPAPTGRPF